MHVHLLIIHAYLTSQDFKAIGIDKKGFQQKLEKEAKKIPGTKFKVDVPVSYKTKSGCIYIYFHTRKMFTHG